jgi:hypothetical protein
MNNESKNIASKICFKNKTISKHDILSIVYKNSIINIPHKYLVVDIYKDNLYLLDLDFYDSKEKCDIISPIIEMPIDMIYDINIENKYNIYYFANINNPHIANAF